MKYKYTKQQAFDKVVEHLVKQGKPAKVGNTRYCSYQTPANLRCAAGCLIEDKKLLKLAKQVGGSWENVVAKVEELKELASPAFITDLQGIHDQGIDEVQGDPDPENWRDNWFSEMKELAKQHKLTTQKLDNLATKKWRSVQL